MGFQDDFARSLKEQRSGGDADVSEGGGGADRSGARHAHAHHPCRHHPRHPELDSGSGEPSGHGEILKRVQDDEHVKDNEDVKNDGGVKDEGVKNDEVIPNDEPVAKDGAVKDSDFMANDGGMKTDAGMQHDETIETVRVDPSPPQDTQHPSPTPRHDGWTPEVRVKFLEALANCGNVGSAATFVQRSRTSAYRLKRRDVDFARGWDAALLMARDIATDVLQDRAINGVEDDVYHQGEVVGTRRRYDSRLLLAHIARLDKLAERVTVSRGAARFGEMMDAIAAEEDTSMLVTDPTTDEIAGIVAEAEAEATVRQVEAVCLRHSNDGMTSEAEAGAAGHAAGGAAGYAPDADLWAAADAQYGPMHQVDWGDGKPAEYSRMTEADAAKLCADYPQVKARRVARDDPGFIAAIVAPNAMACAGLNAGLRGA